MIKSYTLLIHSFNPPEYMMPPRAEHPNDLYFNEIKYEVDGKRENYTTTTRGKPIAPEDLFYILKSTSNKTLWLDPERAKMTRITRKRGRKDD